VVREADLARLYEFVARLSPSPRSEAKGSGATGLPRRSSRSVAEERRRVVLELPIGDLHDETRAVYFSARHGHPIVNGYSGGFPASYLRRKDLLADPPSRPAEAWQALIDSGATCVIVHEWAFEGDNGKAASRWLEEQGALPLASISGSRVYAVER